MTSKEKNEKIEFLKGAEAESKILDYLIQQNRPHNASDISANLRVVKKADVVKCLMYLHESQKIDMKLFGKQAVYCCKQSFQSVVPPSELKEMQVQLEELKGTVKDLKEDNLKIKNELGQLDKLPSTSEIPIVKSELKQNWMELHNRVARLASQEGGEELEEDRMKISTEIAKLDAQIEKYKSIFLSRRKTCKQAVRVIQDVHTDEKARKDFIERIDLEDEPPELVPLLLQPQSIDLPGVKTALINNQTVNIGIKRTISGKVKSVTV